MSKQKIYELFVLIFFIVVVGLAGTSDLATLV